LNNGQWQIGEADKGSRLDQWLASMKRLGSHQRAAKALSNGRVLINKRASTAADAHRLLQPGDVVRIWIDARNAHTLPFVERRFDFVDTIFEDRYLIVLNKPAGLLSVPHPHKLDEESLFELAEEYLNFKRQQPLTVHRIDRGTTGLVIFAKTLTAQENLKEQFLRREPERIYLAITRGIPQPESGLWHDWLQWDRIRRRYQPGDRADERAREAICSYQVLQRFDCAALIEVRLVTGKRNQIRLQAQMNGYPLIGEPIYIDDGQRANDIAFGRQALHAYRLNFRHPMHERVLNLEAPLPDDFTELLERLRSTGAPAVQRLQIGR
jgi:23S rRNA pseudouridine1911/1915/1917 synthase